MIKKRKDEEDKYDVSTVTTKHMGKVPLLRKRTIIRLNQFMGRYNYEPFAPPTIMVIFGRDLYSLSTLIRAKTPARKSLGE